ncbi:MAG: hypothetical protein ACW98D_20990 [Promethearchaeota archaeon]
MAKNRYYLDRGKKRSSSIVFFYLGILGFILVFFPLYSTTLRFQIGRLFSKVFDIIGNLSLFIGGALTFVCIGSIFFGKTLSFKYFIIGVILLWIGCWVSGITTNLFGFTIGNSNTPGDNGYHNF